MKSSAIVLTAAASASAMKVTGTSLVNDQTHIDYINSVATTWTAGVNEKFNGMTYNDVRGLASAGLSHISKHMDTLLPEIKVESVPAAFESYTQWSGLVHPIRDQAYCGSCWAFSSSEAFSDRVSIAAGKLTPVLSPQDMVACDSRDYGCDGGYLNRAWNYIKNTGLVTDDCMPYSSGSGKEGPCLKKCADGSQFIKTKAETVGSINGPSAMQAEIMTHGPIQVAFNVFQSFFSYKKGVYQKLDTEIQAEGGHAVKMVGWGTENGTDYWTVANSWGATWGMDGFFKIRRGSNECDIETDGPPYAGLPFAQ
jgi:cathepsin B